MISRNAGGIAMGASTMLNRVSTLVNIGYGEVLDNDLRSGFTNSETWVKPNPRSGYTNSETWVKPNPRNTTQGDYLNEEDGDINRKGGSI